MEASYELPSLKENSMSQETQLVGGNSPGGTGTLCTDTSLYKTTDNKVEYIEHIAAGTAFPPFPGGSGKGKCVWTKLTLAADGARTNFEPVKVEAGTL
jgi:hypothetical protein